MSQRQGVIIGRASNRRKVKPGSRRKPGSKPNIRKSLLEAQVRQSLGNTEIVTLDDIKEDEIIETKSRAQGIVINPDELVEKDIIGISLAPTDFDQISKVSFKISTVADLDSPRLGYVSNLDVCKTCTYKSNMCTGHIGVIEFDEYINHPDSIKLIEMVLNCICWTCNKLRIGIDDLVEANLISLKTYDDGSHPDPKDPRSYIYHKNTYDHIEIIVTKCKTREQCQSCSVAKTIIEVERHYNEFEDPSKSEFDSRGNLKTAYARKLNFTSSSSSKDNEASGIVGEIFFKTDNDANNSGAIMESSRIYDRFRYLSDDDVYLLGFRGRSHPKNLIMKGIIVLPRRDRPKMANSGNNDPITATYRHIVEVNNSIASHKMAAIGGNKDNDLVTMRANLKMYVRKLISGKSAQTQRTQMKESINEMMIGKTGTLRGTLASMRTNFSARTVAGNNPNLNVDEFGVPESFAKILTKTVNVTTENIEYLQSLVNSEKVSLIVHKELNNLGIPEWKTKRNIKNRYGVYRALKVGDIVHRHLQNGDTIIVSRQPLLTRHSRMGHKVRLISGRGFGMGISGTSPYGLDFDGDELNANVPQILSDKSFRDISLQQCIVTDKNNSPLVGLIYDAPNAMFLLTGGWARAKRYKYVRLSDINNVLTKLNYKTIEQNDPRVISSFISYEDNIGAVTNMPGKSVYKMKMEDAIDVAIRVISDLYDKPKTIREAWNMLSPILMEQKDYMFNISEFMSIADKFYIDIEADYVYANTTPEKEMNMRYTEDHKLITKINNTLRKAIEYGLIAKPPLHPSIEVDADGMPVNLINAILYSEKLYNQTSNIPTSENIQPDDQVYEESDVKEDEWNASKDTLRFSKNITEDNSNAWKIPGRVLFSLILPDDFNYERHGLKIIDGLLVTGTVTGAAIGNKYGSIVQELYLKYDNEDNRGFTAKRFIDNGNRLSNRFIEIHGITIGVDSCFPENKRQAEIDKEKSLYEVYKSIYTMPEASSDPQELERREKQIVQLLSTSKSLQENLVGPDNAIRMIRESGAKGSAFNQRYFLGIIGQQLAEGGRPKMDYGEDMDRTSPYVMPNETAIEARGYCTGNFSQGIDEIEFITTQGVGRLGLVSTAVLTADTGDFQRRLSKGLENLIQDKRGPVVSVRTQNIYQLTYGNIALYPAHMMFDSFPDGNAASFVNIDSLIGMFERKWMSIPKRYLSLEVVDEILDRFDPIIPSPVESHSIMLTDELKKKFRTKLLLTKARVNKTNQDEFVDKVVTAMVEGYNFASMPPGIAVGMRAAEGISEPTTQMTLSSFHNAGSQGSVGFMNIQELMYLMKVKKLITYLYFKPLDIEKYGINPREDDVIIMDKRWRFPRFDDVYDKRREFRNFVVNDIITQIENIYYEYIDDNTLISEGHLDDAEFEYAQLSNTIDIITNLSWYYKIQMNLRLMAIYEMDMNDVISAIQDNVGIDNSPYIMITGYPEDGTLKIFINTQLLPNEDDESIENIVAKDFTNTFDNILQETKIKGYEGIEEVFVEKTNITQAYSGIRRLNLNRNNKWKVFMNSTMCFQQAIGWLFAIRPFILLGFTISDYEFLDYVTTEEESKILVSFVISSSTDLDEDVSPMDMIKGPNISEEVSNSLNIRYLTINGINNQIFARDDISYTFSTTNDVKYTQNILGVVAARNHIFDRLHTVISSQSGYVHPVHMQLAIDWMAYPGTLSPYKERGYANHENDIDAMSRGLYSKGREVLQSASNVGEDMNAATYSTAIATGQLPAVGSRYEPWRKMMVDKGLIVKSTMSVRESVAVDRGKNVDVDDGVSDGVDSSLMSEDEKTDDIVSSLYEQLLGLEPTEPENYVENNVNDTFFFSDKQEYNLEDIDEYNLGDEDDEKKDDGQDKPPDDNVGPIIPVEFTPEVDSFKRKAYAKSMQLSRSTTACIRKKLSK